MKLGKLLFVIIILIPIVIITRPSIEDVLLKYSGNCVKGVLTSDSVRLKYHKADLLYRFMLNGKVYTGNSLISDRTKINDSLCIVFLKGFPSVNRPIGYFKNFSKCSCND
jgi:hypothetical protein